MAFNAAMLTAAIVRIRSDRFATDRRSSVRLKVGGRVRIDDKPAHLLDVSVGGALVRSDDATATGGIHELRIHFVGADDIVLWAEERSRQSVGNGGALVSFEFSEDQEQEIGRMAVRLFGGKRGTREGQTSVSRSAA
jgi:hypothetical protein